MSQIKLGEYGVAVVDFAPADPTIDESDHTGPSIPAAVGVIRVGKKILVDGAWSLARHTTYAAALAGLQISGMSIGVSHGAADPAEALAATIEALGATPDAADWALTGGKGVPAESLGLFANRWPTPGPDDLHRWGALATVAALSCAVDALAGLTYSLPAEPTSAALALADHLTAAGLRASPTPDADILVVEGPASSFDHLRVVGCTARVIVPVGVSVVSPRALAEASRASIAVVPDFCAGAGQLIGRFASDIDTQDVLAERIKSTVSGRILASRSDSQFSRSDSFYLAVCERVNFIAAWQSSLPAARPIG